MQIISDLISNVLSNVSAVEGGELTICIITQQNIEFVVRIVV